MTTKKEAAEPEATDTADVVTTTTETTTATTSAEDWGKAGKDGVRYRTVPHGEQVRVYALTRTGRSANVLAADEAAGRKALAGFVAEHTQQ